MLTLTRIVPWRLVPAGQGCQPTGEGTGAGGRWPGLLAGCSRYGHLTGQVLEDPLRYGL